MIAPSALPTALVSRPTEPSNCEPRVLRRTLGDESERSGELHKPLELSGDHDPQRLELGRDCRASVPEDPADEAEADQQCERQPQPAADRQEAADEARTAIEEDREDDPADDEQKRLREDDDSGDEEREPEPDRRALQLADHHRVAEFGGTGALDVHFGGRRP